MASKQPSTAPQTGTLTMASLQAENQQLQSENKELRARVAALEPLQAQNEQLQSENHDLRARVAALEPLQAGEAALQPQAAADPQPKAAALLPLARRQRQRVGAAPRRMCPQQPAGAQAAGAQAAGASAASASAPQTNDGPPSSAAVRKMGVAAAVAVLEEHGAVARVAADACRRIADLAEEGDRQAALDAGALVAVQAASKAHRSVEAVTDAATDALRNRWADGERLCGDGGCPGSLWT